jgi:hypothetical protein
MENQEQRMNELEQQMKKLEDALGVSAKWSR